MVASTCTSSFSPTVKETFCTDPFDAFSASSLTELVETAVASNFPVAVAWELTVLAVEEVLLAVEDVVLAVVEAVEVVLLDVEELVELPQPARVALARAATTAVVTRTFFIMLFFIIVSPCKTCFPDTYKHPVLYNLVP